MDMKVRCLLPVCPHTTFTLTPRRLCLLLPLLFLPPLLLHSLLLSPALCPNSEGHTVLDTVCQQFSRGLALGDFCRVLCESQTVEPHGCQPSHGGKQVVFPAIFRDSQDVVVKGRSIDLDTETQGSVYYNDESGEEQFPGVEEFTNMVKSHLALNMNITLEENTLYRLWPSWIISRESLSPAQNKLLLASSMKNVWTLVLDSEYVLARLYKHYDVFPELYGSCGGLYVVEKLRPLPTSSFLQRLSFSNWADRARIALAILDLLEELETMFESPLHLCDVKLEHFGLSDNGRVKFLDLDSAQLKPQVDKTVGDGTECSQHSDCHFLDCRGRCDLVTRRCTGGVTNNNLQSVCEKVFLGVGSWGPGLLVSRHASKSLKRAVEECGHPMGSKDGVMLEAGETVRGRLYSSLQEVVEIGARLAAVTD